MALAPQLHAADLLRPAVVVAVAILAQPPSLAGCLTGLPTRGLGTIPLPILGAPIREEELRATTAFASGPREAHREPHLEAPRSRRKRKKKNRRRPNPKKEEEL